MSQDLYKRTSRALSASELNMDIREAIAKHRKLHGLPELLHEGMICLETVSVPQRRGFFQKIGLFKSPTTVQVSLLGKEWLVIVAAADNAGYHAISYRLDQIRADRFSSTLLQAKGINILGHQTGSSEGESLYFIGLGNEPVAGEFERELLQRVNPRPTGLA